MHIRSVLPSALFVAASLTLPAQVRYSADTGDIVINGKPFATYHSGTDIGRPYLSPVRAASGKVVTRHWPMENVEGESRDHPHHRGLWFSYDDVNGVKFWESDPSYTKPNMGKIIASKADWKAGERAGTLTVSMEWRDTKGKALLIEDRTMTFPVDPSLRIIDFDIKLTAKEQVVFGDTKEGAFAIRLADSMAEKNGGKMTNAEGQSTMKNVWGKRSNWVDYSGEVEGEKLGVAMFDHPSNPRHPTYWHARDYGLFALDPFGQKAFDPKAEESHWTLKPGESIRFRWRVLIHPGDTQGAHIDDLYKQYAATR